MKYPCFVWIGRIFQFNILCFGVKNTPFTFNRVGQLFKKFFRGVSNIIYFVVTLAISLTSARCKEDAQVVVYKPVELGLPIKLVEEPSQQELQLGSEEYFSSAVPEVGHRHVGCHHQLSTQRQEDVVR